MTAEKRRADESGFDGSMSSRRYVERRIHFPVHGVVTRAVNSLQRGDMFHTAERLNAPSRYRAVSR
jgi:hypothetical protein